MLVVHPGVAATSVKDLVALAKAAPGKLVFGSAGNGSAVHLAGEQLRASAGINVVHVPYKGTGQSFSDIIGGQLTMLFTTQATGKPMVVAGRVRALAITSPKRTQVMPELMTFTEAGYPAVDAATGLREPDALHRLRWLRRTPPRRKHAASRRSSCMRLASCRCGGRPMVRKYS